MQVTPAWHINLIFGTLLDVKTRSKAKRNHLATVPTPSAGTANGSRKMPNARVISGGDHWNPRPKLAVIAHNTRPR